MNDRSEAKQLFGLQISQARPERKLCLEKSEHVTTIRICFQMAGSRPLDAPMKDSRILGRELAENHVAGLENSNFLSEKLLEV